MASHFHIEGIPPYDGDHEIDLSYLTNRDFHTIKKLSGVRAGEFEEALEKGDNDVIVALAVIALERKGLTVDADVLWNAPAGKMSFVLDDVEEAEDTAPLAQPNASAENESSAEKNGSSGSSGSGAGDSPLARDLSSTGPPDSATGVTSDPVISET